MMSRIYMKILIFYSFIPKPNATFFSLIYLLTFTDYTYYYLPLFMLGYFNEHIRFTLITLHTLGIPSPLSFIKNKYIIIRNCSMSKIIIFIIKQRLNKRFILQAILQHIY